MNNKLELTWVGKNNRSNVEPRILVYDEEKSYGEKDTGNILIHGDNLLALKALEKDYASKIKCIYIDPPYNTGSAFEHYDDNLEHSIWLGLMRDRLEILKKLLTKDGTIWISIDADESHYLKVLCDEIFGRKNFIDEVVWQRSFSPINLKKTLSRAHDTILVYAKNKTPDFTLNGLPRSNDANDRYKNPDNDPRGPWTSGDLSVGPAIKEKIYEIITPSGRIVTPPDGYCWRLTKDKFEEYVADNRIWFGEKGDNVPRIKRFLSDVKQGITAMTWWTRDEVGDNQAAKKEIKALNINTDSVFDTPKCERLIERILILATEPGDYVLDSFLGSGTTAAVAHKMNRKWIGIEMGDHCYSWCKQRLDLVINNEDAGGISKSVNWQGGGGYDFYELAPSLIEKDIFDQEIINKKYNEKMLSEAVALHEGFNYEPSKSVFWKQAKANENSFLYVTLNFVGETTLDKIYEELKENEYLIIACVSYDKNIENKYKSIKIKKIPEMLLNKCEYGVNNYNLNVVETEEEALEDE